MKICTLKIQPKFWEMIKSGEKKYEVRKMNKNYIQVSDIIRFTDLDGKELGYAIVFEKTVGKPIDFFGAGLDIETEKFIADNYWGVEENILCFEIALLEMI